MDPSVTAALIAAPIAVLTAAAAFAAGRLQARGAHRGPIDAVRRQHQRDAYAALLTALQAYEFSASPTRCQVEAGAVLSAAGTAPTRQQLRPRVLEMIKDVPVAPVFSAFSVVELEGPDQVAQAARLAVLRTQVMQGVAQTEQLLSASQGPTPSPDRRQFRAAVLAILGTAGELPDLATAADPVAVVHGQLRTDINAFTLEARSELNRRPE